MNGCTTASDSSVTVGSIQVVGWIDDRDAGEHVRHIDPITERRRRGRELHARIDALCFSGIVGDVHRDEMPGRHEIAHGICQIQLALRVDRLKPVERGPEQLGLEDVDRGVRLADRELLG